MAQKANKFKNPEADLEKLEKMYERIDASSKNLSSGKGSFSRS